MPVNTFASNDDADKLPAPIPVQPPVGTDDAKQSKADIPDTHPVFGSTVQPQEIKDQEIVGSRDLPKPLSGEDGVVGFDPENDSRMQESPAK